MVRKTLIVAAGILFGGGVAIALACECAHPPSPKDALVKADAVFAGTVESIEEPALIQRGTDFFSAPRKVIFRVSQSWKGTNAVTLVVHTGWGGGDCGYRFVSHSSYVVYANQRDEAGSVSTNLSTSICTRTREYAKAADDFRDLGAGRKPTTK